MALAAVHYVELRTLTTVLPGVQLWQVQFQEICIFSAAWLLQLVTFYTKLLALL
jgi:hypothetical protein